MKYMSQAEQDFFENRRNDKIIKPTNQEEAEFFAKRGYTALKEENDERITNAINPSNIDDAIYGEIRDAIKNSDSKSTYVNSTVINNPAIPSGLMGTSASQLAKSTEGSKERYQEFKRQQQLKELSDIPEYDMNNEFDRIKAKYRLGQLTDVEGKEWTMAANSGDIEHAKAISNTVALMVQRYPELIEDIKVENPTMIDKIKNTIIGGVEGAAEMMPTMIGAQLRGMETGLPAAGGFAGMAAALGQAGPQALAPEEIVTVPGAFIGGYKVGSASGTSSYMYEVEKGQSYKAMIDDGVDPATANKWSTVVGLANAGIELAQIDTVLKSFKGFDDVLTKAGQKSITKYLKKDGVKQLASYAKGVANETAQEVAQESVSIAGEYAGKKENGQEATLFNQNNLDRLIDTAIQSAQTFAVIHGAGQTAGNISRLLDSKKTINDTVNEIEKSAVPLTENQEKQVEQLNQSLLEYYNSEDISDANKQWVVDTQNRLNSAMVNEQSDEGASNIPDYLKKEKNLDKQDANGQSNQVVEKEQPKRNKKLDTSELETVMYNGKEHVVLSNYKDNVSIVPKDTVVYVDKLGAHRPNETEQHSTSGLWVPRSNLETTQKVEINSAPRSWSEYKEVSDYYAKNKADLNMQQLQEIKSSYEEYLLKGHPTRDLTEHEIRIYNNNMKKVVKSLIEVGNDRNNMTFERSIGGITNAFTITRGQEYEVSVRKKRQRATIIGISHANGKVKYKTDGMSDGVWIDRGFIYPLTEAITPQITNTGKEQILSKTIDSLNEKNKPVEEFSEGDKFPQNVINTDQGVKSNKQQKDKNSDSNVQKMAYSETVNKYKSGIGNEIKPVHDIINDIKKEFKLGYTTKRFRHKGAAAVYKKGSKVIESKIANTIGPTMHELGHHLDSKYEFTNKHDLSEMINKLPEDFRKQYKKKELPGEALAEYVRMYLTTPMESSNFAGNFEMVFIESLEKDDFDKLQRIQSDTMKWLGASIEEQINSTLVSHLDKKKFKDYKKDFTAQLKLLGKKQYMFLFNELQPLGDLVKFIENSSGKKLSSDKNFELLADTSLRSPMIAKSITVDGMINPEGDVVDVSFKEVLKDITEDEYQDFSNYLIAKRALDYYKRGKRTFSDDIPIDYVKLMVDKYEQEKPKFNNTANKVYEWWRHFTEEWIVGTGLLEEKAYEKMKELEPHYVPFFRQRNENVLIGDAVKQIANRGYTDQRNPMKRSSQTGSADPIFYPIESMLMEIERYVTTVKKREVMLAIHDTYSELVSDSYNTNEGLGQIINKVNPAMKMDKVDMVEKKLELTSSLYSKFVETLSKEEQLEYKAIINEGTRSNDENMYKNALEYIHSKGFNAMEIVDEIVYDTEIEFKPMDIDKELNIVTIKDRDNVTHHYEVYDPLLLQALLNVDTSHLDDLTKHTIAARRVMQSLITTFDPLFMIKNIVRDSSQGFTASAVNVRKYHTELFKAIHNEIKGGEWSKAYRRAGGGYASPTGADRNALNESLAEVIPGWKKQHKTQTALQAIEKVADAIEQAPRIVEYKGHIDKYGDTFETRLEALYRAQDVTTNFQRKGQVMRMWYGNLIPFFNAGLQGLDKFRRMHTKGNLKNTVPRALLGITMVTLSLYAMNRRDPEYHKLNKYVRDNYYLIPTGENGKYIRLPKAREIGMLYGATFERAMEYAIEKDPEAWDGYLRNLASVMMPPHEMITKGFIDASNNKTWYGGSIVSYQYQNMQLDQQYRNTTSKFSRELAKIIPDSWGNISSPMVIDYLMLQYTGVIGKTLIPMTDDVKGNGLDYAKRTFSTDVAYSNDVVNKFYDRYDDIKKIESTAKAGRQPKNPEMIVARDLYSTAHDAIGELSSLYIAIDSMSDEEFEETYIEFSKDMTKAEARRMVKLSILELADKTNDYYDNVMKNQ